MQSISPSQVKHVKESGQFVRFLEDAVESLTETIKAVGSDTPFTLRCELYENGYAKVYLDNKLLSQVKLPEEVVRELLLGIRDDHFHNRIH